MKITDQLTKPLLARITSEYDALYREIKQNASPEAKETQELQHLIEQKIGQIEDIHTIEESQQQSLQNPNAAELREYLRQLKLQLRFTRRKWKRQLLSESRIEKIRRKKAHVSTAAA